MKIKIKEKAKGRHDLFSVNDCPSCWKKGAFPISSDIDRPWVWVSPFYLPPHQVVFCPRKPKEPLFHPPPNKGRNKTAKERTRDFFHPYHDFLKDEKCLKEPQWLKSVPHFSPDPCAGKAEPEMLIFLIICLTWCPLFSEEFVADPSYLLFCFFEKTILQV